MIYNVNFRCYYPNGNCNDHRRRMDAGDIPRWIDSYKFTHPDCISISIKVWFDDPDEDEAK